MSSFHVPQVIQCAQGYTESGEWGYLCVLLPPSPCHTQHIQESNPKKGIEWMYTETPYAMNAQARLKDEDPLDGPPCTLKFEESEPCSAVNQATTVPVENGLKRRRSSSRSSRDTSSGSGSSSSDSGSNSDVERSQKRSLQYSSLSPLHPFTTNEPRPTARYPNLNGTNIKHHTMI